MTAVDDAYIAVVNRALGTVGGPSDRFLVGGDLPVLRLGQSSPGGWRTICTHGRSCATHRSRNPDRIGVGGGGVHPLSVPPTEPSTTLVESAVSQLSSSPPIAFAAGVVVFFLVLITLAVIRR